MRIVSILFSIGLLLSGCKDILNVEDISESEVQLIAPSNQSTLGIDTINFSWETVEFAESYRLRIVTPNFETPAQLVLDTLVTNTNFTTPLSPGDYAWQVRAENSGFASTYSLSRSLTVSDIPFSDRTVTLVSPANDTDSNDMMQTLRWQTVPTADSYLVKILDNADALVKEETVMATEYLNTFTEGLFKWQVQAKNGNETTAFSTSQLTIDLTVPSKPALLLPADDSTTTETVISFSWDRTDVPGSMEIDSIFVFSDSSLQNLVIKDQASNKVFSTTLDIGEFFWGVRSYDNAGNSSEPSDTSSFTIQ